MVFGVDSCGAGGGCAKHDCQCARSAPRVVHTHGPSLYSPRDRCQSRARKPHYMRGKTVEVGSSESRRSCERAAMRDVRASAAGARGVNAPQVERVIAMHSSTRRSGTLACAYRLLNRSPSPSVGARRLNEATAIPPKPHLREARDVASNTPVVWSEEIEGNSQSPRASRRRSLGVVAAGSPAGNPSASGARIRGVRFSCPLFDRDGLGEIARLVHVGAALIGHVIREQLQRDRRDQRRECFERRGNDDRVLRELGAM